MLRELSEGTEVLFIERAVRQGDPWSGHMAFPGGRIEPVDDTTRCTALRETREEIGLDLNDAEYLGPLDDLQGRGKTPAPIVISAHIFAIEGAPKFELETSEVQSAFWFPLAGLLEESRHVEHRIVELPETLFPGVVVGEPGRHIVWGLTFRFLERLFGMVERPFPHPWSDVRSFEEESG